MYFKLATSETRPVRRIHPHLQAWRPPFFGWRSAAPAATPSRSFSPSTPRRHDFRLRGTLAKPELASSSSTMASRSTRTVHGRPGGQPVLRQSRVLQQRRRQPARTRHRPGLPPSRQLRQHVRPLRRRERAVVAHATDGQRHLQLVAPEPGLPASDDQPRARLAARRAVAAVQPERQRPDLPRQHGGGESPAPRADAHGQVSLLQLQRLERRADVRGARPERQVAAGGPAGQAPRLQSPGREPGRPLAVQRGRGADHGRRLGAMEPERGPRGTADQRGVREGRARRGALRLARRPDLVQAVIPAGHFVQHGSPGEHGRPRGRPGDDGPIALAAEVRRGRPEPAADHPDGDRDPVRAVLAAPRDAEP